MGLGVAIAVNFLVGCGGSSEATPNAADKAKDYPLPGRASVDKLPMPTDPVLLLGRSVVEGTCQGCHALGIASSPKITDIKAWAPRIAQGKDVLYEHAINGHFGTDGAFMPARGGNSDLTDKEIKAAVDYMVANSQ